MPVSVEDPGEAGGDRGINNTIISAKAKHGRWVEGRGSSTRVGRGRGRFKLYPPMSSTSLSFAESARSRLRSLENKLFWVPDPTLANLQRIGAAIGKRTLRNGRGSRPLPTTCAARSRTPEVETLAFNNLLVKKRPGSPPGHRQQALDDGLGQREYILGKMRGEQSIVAKGQDGFTVNGNAATSLSGSGH